MQNYLTLIPKEIRTIIALYVYQTSECEIREIGFFNDVLEDLTFWSTLFKQGNFKNYSLEKLLDFDKNELIKHKKLSKKLQLLRLTDEYDSVVSAEISKENILNEIKGKKYTIGFKINKLPNYDIFYYHLEEKSVIFDKFMTEIWNVKAVLSYDENMNFQESDIFELTKNDVIFFSLKDDNFHQNYMIDIDNYDNFLDELLWITCYHRIGLSIHIYT